METIDSNGGFMIDDISNKRIDAVNAYFRKVDAGDSTVLDLLTDDVQIFFPKLGLGHGKDTMVRFSQVLMSDLESIEHDFSAFNYICSGNYVVVEGKERGITRTGIRWPDGIVSEGRFCNVFEFEGALIRRLHVYVDPDFASADHSRVAWGAQARK
jgi:ketosteroid isomerase-like protein